MGLSPQEEKVLRTLESSFEATGGRGVELAEEIDKLRAKRDRPDPPTITSMEDLRERIALVVAYNWQSEFRDAKEHGLEGHVMNHLIALAGFVGVPITEDLWAELYDTQKEVGND